MQEFTPEALQEFAAALPGLRQAMAEHHAHIRDARIRCESLIDRLQASIERDRVWLAERQAETARLIDETDAMLARWDAEDAALDA
jgi:predicted phage tail protein